MAEISALKTQKIVVVPSYLQLIHLSGLEKKTVGSWRMTLNYCKQVVAPISAALCVYGGRVNSTGMLWCPI